MSNKIATEDKRLCTNCILNFHLRDLMKNERTKQCSCDYCERDKIETISLKQMASIFDEHFSANYKEADNILREEHGYPDEGQSLSEIIKIEVRPNSEEIEEDIKNVCRQMWRWENIEDAEIDYHSMLYNYVGVGDHGLLEQWDTILESLRNEARYLNPNALKFIDKLFNKLPDYLTKNNESLIVDIGKDSNLDRVFRARVFQNDEDLIQALENPEVFLGPPPIGKTGVGRMNAKGVSAFYGATSDKLAIAEVRPPMGSKVAVAEFNIIKKLRLLDLTKFRDIESAPRRNIFDKTSLYQAQLQKFLSKIENALMKPVMPDHREDQYLITQVISDYISTNENLNIDGIMYRSSQVSSTKETNNERNITLFSKASKVLQNFTRNKKNISASIGCVEDDGYEHIYPTIWYMNTTSKLPNIDDFIEPEDYALKLDENSIKLHVVKNIEVYTDDYQVKLVTPNIFD